MKALFVLTSLKQDREKSNTMVLCEMVAEKLLESGADVELVHLAELDFAPGVDREVNGPDDMTKVMGKVLDADMLILASPVWWGQHSSLAQAFFERMTYFDDWYIKNQANAMYGKTFGCIITNADDGVQSVMGNAYNWATLLGFTIPPEAFASYTGEGGEENIRNNEPTQAFVEIFSRNMYEWTKLLVDSKIGLTVQTKGGKKTGYLVTD